VIQRKTQTVDYWQNYTLTPIDIEFLHTRLLDAEQPMTQRELALALIGDHCHREESQLRGELSRGTVYQPRRHFQVGEKVLFPAFEFRLAEVIAVRPGQNREYGEFEVITVDFGPERRQREFAAGLTAPHKLNVEMLDLLATDDLASPEKLLTTVAAHVPAALAAQLATQPDFASFENRWLLRDLMAETHVGHLNIAEALIEVRGAPVETTALLKELDLPGEIRRDVLAFSLQSALTADGRFDQVGPNESRRWYLRRLEPPEALEIPLPLRYTAIPYDKEALPVELRQLEWELDDEWSDEVKVEPSALRAAIPTTTLLLTYPHLASGTLPLNKHSRPFFPRGYGARTAVTLIDGRWGQRFLGWVVHAGRYVAGLRAWFEQHKLPAGAVITLERRDNSGDIVVDFRPKRMRREWTRRALISDANRLDIELRKVEVTCEYDEQIIIGADKPEELLKLRTLPAYASIPLGELVYHFFTDLAGLSGVGNVHAKTIYSAVNLVRRCPPGPIFAVLATDPRLQIIGDDSYRLAV
jgi:hypothetical protein